MYHRVAFRSAVVKQSLKQFIVNIKGRSPAGHTVRGLGRGRKLLSSHLELFMINPHFGGSCRSTTLSPWPLFQSEDASWIWQKAETPLCFFPLVSLMFADVHSSSRRWLRFAFLWTFPFRLSLEIEVGLNINIQEMELSLVFGSVLYCWDWKTRGGLNLLTRLMRTLFL